tara:strand:- start:701 stop:1189 length:489 start_codon:yes stop_codon:yes gene_type:complete
MMKSNIQLRFAPTTMDGAVLRGVAVPYESPSGDLRDMPQRGTYREVFQRGAFGKISDGVALYVQHDPQQIPLARVGAGTLRFTETNKGLEFEASISPTRADLIDSLQRGDLAGASIGFSMKEEKWIRNASPPVRRVTRGRLHELSLVVEPAFPKAIISSVEV